MVCVASPFMEKNFLCKSYLARRSTPTPCVGQLGVEEANSLDLNDRSPEICMTGLGLLESEDLRMGSFCGVPAAGQKR